jgi:hypothetical protein
MLFNLGLIFLVLHDVDRNVDASLRQMEAWFYRNLLCFGLGN